MGSTTWRAIASLLVLLVTISSQDELSFSLYAFTNGNIDFEICPFIDLFAPSLNPSFAVRPLSTDANFLLGSYTWNGEINGFRFSPNNRTCGSDMCTELRVTFDDDSVMALRINNLVIHYTSSTDEQRSILVKYASVGIYLEDPEQQIFRPRVDNMKTLDGNLLIYGGPDRVQVPLVLCEEGGNKSSLSLIFPIDNQVPCRQSASGPGQGRPQRRAMVVEGVGMGEHRVYVSANNACSSAIRSKVFVISFEAPPTTEETVSSVTTVGVGATGGIDVGLVTGLAIFCAIVVVVLPVVIIVLMILVRRYQARQVHREEYYVPPDGGGTSSPNLQDSSKLLHETNQNGAVSHGKGDVNVPKNHDMKYLAFAGPESDWCEALKGQLSICHKTEYTSFEDFLRFRSNLASEGWILYIMRDLNGEITNTDIARNPLPRHREIMRQVESLCSDEACSNNVFVVQFKASEERHVQLQHYYLLMRTEDPTTAGFSFSSCAQSIHNKVKEIRREHVESVDGQNQPRPTIDKETGRIKKTLNTEEEQSTDSGNEQKLVKKLDKVMAALKTVETSVKTVETSVKTVETSVKTVETSVRNEAKITRNTMETEAKITRNTMEAEGELTRGTVKTEVRTEGELTRGTVKTEADQLQTEVAAGVAEVFNGMVDVTRRLKEEVVNPSEDQ